MENGRAPRGEHSVENQERMGEPEARNTPFAGGAVGDNACYLVGEGSGSSRTLPQKTRWT